jgi:hypothetical protein
MVRVEVVSYCSSNFQSVGPIKSIRFVSLGSLFESFDVAEGFCERQRQNSSSYFATSQLESTTFK